MPSKVSGQCGCKAASEVIGEIKGEEEAHEEEISGSDGESPGGLQQ